MTAVQETSNTITLARITKEEQLPAVKELFLEYANSLSFSLCFQSFGAEMQELLKRYGPPQGALILASVDGENAGCAAMHKLSEGICEMKRLYVRDAYRGLGLGKRLVTAVIESAKSAGYRAIRLDTLASMKAAQHLYLSFGFYDIEPYADNPLSEARYMEYTITA